LFSEGSDPRPFSPQLSPGRVGYRDVLLFPDSPERQAERFAYYEASGLVNPHHSIWDSNAVRSARLTAAERRHLRRMRR
jgi:hypothetical protein